MKTSPNLKISGHHCKDSAVIKTLNLLLVVLLDKGRGHYKIRKGVYNLHRMQCSIMQGQRNQSGWSGQNQTAFSALGWVMIVYFIYRMVKIVR